MSNITIRLDNDQYYPGSKIKGEAMCYFQSPKEFKSKCEIELVFKLLMTFFRNNNTLTRS